VQKQGRAGDVLSVADLGTGSGCLVLSLLHELKSAYGFALDVSGKALRVALENSLRLGLYRRCAFLCAEGMEAVKRESFDIVLCNPPYIRKDDIADLSKDVREYDPALALDGGESGYKFYESFIPQIAASLKPGGLAVVEAGIGQAAVVDDLLHRSGVDTATFPAQSLFDLSGVKRAVAGLRQ
jgi:release factor glutamine methyltransferase